MQENQNYEEHACQNTGIMETSNFLGQDMSYQIFARKFLGKVAKSGGVCFNLKNAVNAQSKREHFPPPPPPARPSTVK